MIHMQIMQFHQGYIINVHYYSNASDLAISHRKQSNKIASACTFYFLVYLLMKICSNWQKCWYASQLFSLQESVTVSQAFSTPNLVSQTQCHCQAYTSRHICLPLKRWPTHQTEEGTVMLSPPGKAKDKLAFPLLIQQLMCEYIQSSHPAPHLFEAQIFRA